MNETQATRRGRENYNKSGKSVARRDKRAQEAAARDREYQALSVKDRIAHAKARRGDSKREIARLEKKLKKA